MGKKAVEAAFLELSLLKGGTCPQCGHIDEPARVRRSLAYCCGSCHFSVRHEEARQIATQYVQENPCGGIDKWRADNDK